MKFKEFFNKEFNKLWNKIEDDIEKEKSKQKIIQENLDKMLAELISRHQEEMNDMKEMMRINEEKNEKSRINYEKGLGSLFFEFRNNMKKIEEDAEKERQKMINRQIEIENEYKNKILENQILEEKKKRQKLEEEKRKEEKKKIINESFNQKVEIMKTEKIREIEKEFSKIKENFCIEEIKNFDQNKIIELI